MRFSRVNSFFTFISFFKINYLRNEVLLNYIKLGETCIVSVMAGEKGEKANAKGVVEEDCSVLLIPSDQLYKLGKNRPSWNLFISINSIYQTH